MRIVTEDVNLGSHDIASEDREPTNIVTDDTGKTFPGTFPQVLGKGKSDVARYGPANPGGEQISQGVPGLENTAEGIFPNAMLTPDSSGWRPNPEYAGQPGRVDRLATDILGPAHVGTVESFRMDGSRISPGRPDIARGGPVGAGTDLGQYLAVAMAQSTYDFPAQDLAQLNVLLGI